MRWSPFTGSIGVYPHRRFRRCRRHRAAAGFTVIDDYGHPSGGNGRDAGGGPAAPGLSAASCWPCQPHRYYPHTRLLRGLRPGAGYGRRGLVDRSLCGRRSAPGGGGRPRPGARAARGRQGGAGVCRRRCRTAAGDGGFRARRRRRDRDGRGLHRQGAGADRQTAPARLHRIRVARRQEGNSIEPADVGPGHARGKPAPRPAMPRSPARTAAGWAVSACCMVAVRPNARFR